MRRRRPRPANKKMLPYSPRLGCALGAAEVRGSRNPDVVYTQIKERYFLFARYARSAGQTREPGDETAQAREHAVRRLARNNRMKASQSGRPAVGAPLVTARRKGVFTIPGLGDMELAGGPAGGGFGCQPGSATR
jgi:hypothetical protein